MKRTFLATISLMITLMLASGCQPTPDDHATDDEMPVLSAADLVTGESLRVVATTNIVADVVRNVGGNHIDLATLIPVGTDPHTFEPIPQDIAAVADAHVVFANGAGLETFLDLLLESAGEDVPVVPLSHNIDLIQLEQEGEEEEAEHEHEHNEVDPHIWFDPQNVMVWADSIAQALSDLDPGNAEAYAANAAAYTAELAALDGWIEEQIAQIPEPDRQLVTDHTAFSYFTQQYGFEQIGAVFPGYSTLSEPSAQQLAALEDAIREYEVPAVFVGITVNPDLAQRVADDTGTQLVFLYTGSLSDESGPANDYLSLMRYNVHAIVDALQ
jgi:ABC-type Zn uptake system ZnuABC Zn-binding protein ZnuA